MVWSYCVFHNDNIRPNLSISLLDEYYGRYKCWACGKTGRLSKNQMNRLNVSALAPLSLRSSKRKKRKFPTLINWMGLTLFYCDNYRPAIEGKALADLWNVRGDSLSDFSAGWDGEAYTFPMSNSDSERIGIQRVWIDGKKKAVHGSRLGLFLPIIINTKTVFITEGISDAVAVYDIGFDVVGKPCATFGDNIIKDFIQSESISKIIIIPDNNDAGRKSCNDIIKAVRDIIDYKVFQFDKAEDIREYIFEQGKSNVKKELLRMT